MCGGRETNQYIHLEQKKLKGASDIGVRVVWEFLCL